MACGDIINCKSNLKQKIEVLGMDYDGTNDYLISKIVYFLYQSGQVGHIIPSNPKFSLP